METPDKTYNRTTLPKAAGLLSYNLDNNVVRQEHNFRIGKLSYYG